MGSACGCGGADPPLQAAGMKEMCNVGAREMETIAFTSVMNDPSKIHVPAPPLVANFRTTVADLRNLGEEMKDKLVEVSNKDIGEHVAEKMKNIVGGKEGGFRAGVLGFAGKMFDQGVEKTGELMSVGAQTTLNAMADVLEKAVDTVEADFTKVGTTTIETKREEIVKVYSNYINNYNFNDSVTLIRGTPIQPHPNGPQFGPWGQEEYMAVPGDSISKNLNTAAANELKGPMGEVVQDAINKQGIVKTWDLISDTLQSAKNFIIKIGGLDERFNIQGTDREYINDHCVNETLKAIGVLMGTYEAEARQDSTLKSNMSSRPATFEVVFSGNVLCESDLKDMRDGKDDMNIALKKRDLRAKRAAQAAKK